MKSTDTLVQEHDNILRMLKVIRQAQLKILAGGEPDTADFRKVISFIRLYADKTHHGKEEQFLFNKMVDELGEMGKNLINHGMLVEHDLARYYVMSLEQAIESYEASPNADARLNILIYSGAYCDLLNRHITKENTAVFTFGERALSDEAKAQVELDMAAFESDPVNIEVREAQLEALGLLEQKYF